MFRSLLLARCKKVFLNFHDGKIKLFSKGIKNLSISKSIIENSRSFHRSSICCDLMEFFDDSKNWGEEEVKSDVIHFKCVKKLKKLKYSERYFNKNDQSQYYNCIMPSKGLPYSGRAWTIDELRIKSNSDLHKLWFVLYKEKNMLLTMEQAAKEEVELFPSPERIDKVEISMENLEAVVRERNEAYYLLETGETGERPHGWKEDEFGRFNYVPLEEHLIPMKENKKFLEEDLFPTMETVNPTVPEFLLKLSEKERFLKRIERKKQRMHIKKLFKEFPNMDMEALQEQYPDVDVYQYKKYLEERDEL